MKIWVAVVYTDTVLPFWISIQIQGHRLGVCEKLTWKLRRKFYQEYTVTHIYVLRNRVRNSVTQVE